MVGYVQWRHADVIVRRINQIDESQVYRGRGRPKKTIKANLRFSIFGLF